MPQFLAQVSYTPEAWAALVRNPHDRVNQVVTRLTDELGGKPVGTWFSFGDHDVVVVFDVPDNTAAAAASIVINAGGAVSNVKVTPLLTADEAIAAMEKAQRLSYTPPH